MQKRDRHPGEPQPTYHHHITIDGKLLSHNQEATLERGIGYPAGRYKFEYAEQCDDGQWCLVFFGPVRRTKQRYRQVWRQAAAVRVIHRPRLDDALQAEEVPAV